MNLIFLCCLDNYAQAGKINLDSKIDMIVVKKLSCGRNVENLHSTRFFWGYKEIKYNNKILLTTTFTSQVKIKEISRALMSLDCMQNDSKPHNSIARRCLIAFPVNNPRSRINMFREASEITIKMELYNSKSKKYSVIWGNNFFVEYKGERYLVTEKFKNLIYGRDVF